MMRITKEKVNLRQESGTAVIEFTLVLAFFMLLCFGSIAMTYHMRAQLYALNASSLAIEAVYRDCRFESPPDRPACMNAIKANIENAMTVTGFDVRIILGLFEDTMVLLGGTPPFIGAPSLKYQTSPVVTLGGNAYTSKFNGTFNSAILKHYELNGMFWTAEAFVRNPFKYDFVGGGVAYESSIS